MQSQVNVGQVMKVLLVHHKLGEYGGAEAYIRLCAAELRQRGHLLSMLYCEATGVDEQSWRQNFNECQALPANASNRVVLETLNRFQPDLVFLHIMPDLGVLEALLDSGVPVIRVVHDHAMYCMRGYKYNYFTRHICTRAASPWCVFPCLASVARNRNGGFPLKWVSYSEKRREIRLNQRCAKVIVYSDYQKQELVRNGFAPDAIEMCVPIRMLGHDGPTSSFSDRNIILFAGQIIRGKGVDVLLEALSKVRLPFECRILGDGNHRAACEQLSRRLGLTDRVRFCGYLLPDQLREHYLESTLLVVSSLWPEPFALTGPEAMRYGLPVVAFDSGGIGEWLIDGHTGYMVPWKDTTAMAARIETLLRDKAQARQMGRNAREWVQRYDSNKQLDYLEGLFRRVLRKGQHPSSPQLTTRQEPK